MISALDMRRWNTDNGICNNQGSSAIMIALYSTDGWINIHGFALSIRGEYCDMIKMRNEKSNDKRLEYAMWRWNEVNGICNNQGSSAIMIALYSSHGWIYSWLCFNHQ